MHTAESLSFPSVAPVPSPAPDSCAWSPRSAEGRQGHLELCLGPLGRGQGGHPRPGRGPRQAAEPPQHLPILCVPLLRQSATPSDMADHRAPPRLGSSREWDRTPSGPEGRGSASPALPWGREGGKQAGPDWRGQDLSLFTSRQRLLPPTPHPPGWGLSPLLHGSPLRAQEGGPAFPPPTPPSHQPHWTK